MSRPCLHKLTVILTLVGSLFLSAQAFAALPNVAAKEAIIRQAQGLLEQEEPPAAIREAAAILTKYESSYSADPLYLLSLAEAYYRMADPAGDIDKEYPLYQKAEGYAFGAIKINPALPEAHYWYGLCLLKKAQKTGGISAYFHAKNGIRELEKVRAAKPSYDHSGASRVLGLLYCLAPGWSPFGDIDKSIRLAEESIRLDPSYPLNRLYLANAYFKRGDRVAAAREYRKLLTTAPRRGEGANPFYREKAREMLASLQGK